MRMRLTGHVDTFAENHLPPPGQMPELIFDEFAVPYPEQINAAALFLDRHVDSGGSADRCIVLPGGGGWSYANLLAVSNRIARVLVEDLGLEPGNRVLLHAPNTPMLAACWFAVLKAGGIVVTTMPLYRAGELRIIMEKARVTYALCDTRLRDEFDAGLRAQRRTMRVLRGRRAGAGLAGAAHGVESGRL